MYDLVWVICPWCVISCSWCCCQKASPLFSFTCLGNDFQYNWFAIKNMIILHRTLSLFFFFCCITYRNSIRRLALNKLVFPISSFLYCFWNYLDKNYFIESRGLNRCTFKISCVLTFLLFQSLGRPKPQVRWLQSGIALSTSSEVSSGSTVTSNVILESLDRSDNGLLLTCEASNNNISKPVRHSVSLLMNRKFYVFIACSLLPFGSWTL